MKKMLLFLFIAFMSKASIYADQVSLMNDSPFVLTATVLAADGSFLQKVTLQPGDTKNWTTPTDVNTTTNEGQSITPFTVIWKCGYKGFYSMCTNVSPGALVTPNTCEGSRYCEPKPKKKEGEHQ